MKLIKVGFLMDDIKNIKPEKDSSLAMMLEAQSRAWDCYTFDTNDMFIADNQVFANVSKTKVYQDKKKWFKKENSKVISLDKFDVIFMRKDPPFNMNYIYTTYLLEQAENNGVLVVNKPSSLRDANEKLFAINFPNCIPKSLVSTNKEQIKEFIKKQKIAIVKPLDGMGGKDIFKLEYNDDKTDDIINYLTKNGKNQIITQQFLTDIKKGDKRILLIDGKPIDYALARIPSKNNFKGNLAAGATGIGKPLSKRDYWLCEQIAPTLKAKKLIFVGIDVIGDYITEINVTSPTCIRELDKIFNLNIAGKLLDVIAHKLANKIHN